MVEHWPQILRTNQNKLWELKRWSWCRSKEKNCQRMWRSLNWNKISESETIIHEGSNSSMIWFESKFLLIPCSFCKRVEKNTKNRLCQTQAYSHQSKQRMITVQEKYWYLLLIVTLTHKCLNFDLIEVPWKMRFFKSDFVIVYNTKTSKK